MNGQVIVDVYNLLLGRTPESEDVISAWLHRYTNVHEVIEAIQRSPEYLLKYGLLPIPSPRLVELFSRFTLYNGAGEPGYWTDFLGARTNVKDSGSQHLDGTVQGLPFHTGQEWEWYATLKAASEAQSEFVVFELGAGWAPWLVRSVFALQQHRQVPFYLVGVEASSKHFRMMLNHLRVNGIDPERQKILHGAVSDKDGFARFPRIDETSEDWGAGIAAVATDWNALSEEPLKSLRAGENYEEYESVPSYGLNSLLEPFAAVDLIHIDLQGLEYDVLRAAVDQVSQKVKWLCIGTHSSPLELKLTALLLPAGWHNEKLVQCTEDEHPDGTMDLRLDGCQVWRNPRFA